MNTQVALALFGSAHVFDRVLSGTTVFVETSKNSYQDQRTNRNTIKEFLSDSHVYERRFEKESCDSSLTRCEGFIVFGLCNNLKQFRLSNNKSYANLQPITLKRV